MRRLILPCACLAAACISATAVGGTLLDERIGINFNNRYADPDTKTDWLGLSMDVNDTTVTQTINDLSMTVAGGYKNYRLGFSKAMALNASDLDQWLDTVEEVANNGNKVLVPLWSLFASNGGDISDPAGDAVAWRNVVQAVDARGLTDAISGWEIQNEPEGSASQWRNYVRAVWKGVGGYENVAWNDLTDFDRTQISRSWELKPIVVQGTSYGQNFNSTLVNGLDEIPNLVWSIHDYSKFSNITTERESWTVEQWEDHYLTKWQDKQSLLNGNYVVTELGMNNNFDPTLTGLGSAGTSADDRRDAGFIRAAEERYGEGTGTSVFWYSNEDQ